MTREVLLSSEASKEFSRFDEETRNRIRKALLRFSEGGRGDVKRLKGVRGGPDLFRLRVGNYRVVFAATSTELRVTRIIHRSLGYDWL